MRRIRVAFCLDSFAIGGTELNAVRTAEALDPTRIELHVIHLQTQGPLRNRYEKLGIRMLHFPIRNLYSPSTAAQGLRLARQLRAWDIDVLHSHDIYSNIFAVPWARAMGNCAVIASRRWMYEAPRRALVPLNRMGCLFANRIVANSPGVCRLLVRDEGVSERKVVELPNFLSPEAFALDGESERAACRAAWGVPPGAFVVGIVARLSPVKNHALLLEAAGQLDSRFHLVIIGDGPSRANLEAQAARLGIATRVHFTGEVVSSRNLHQHFDVSVLCSSSEGFPNSLIEAMAAARPVVATPVGGVVDAVTSEVNGLLVPVGNPEALAVALRRLQAEPSLAARLGERGREDVRRRYDRSVVIGRLSDLYGELARHTGG